MNILRIFFAILSGCFILKRLHRKKDDREKDEQKRDQNKIHWQPQTT